MMLCSHAELKSAWVLIVLIRAEGEVQVLRRQ